MIALFSHIHEILVEYVAMVMAMTMAAAVVAVVDNNADDDEGDRRHRHISPSFFHDFVSNKNYSSASFHRVQLFELILTYPQLISTIALKITVIYCSARRLATTYSIIIRNHLYSFKFGCKKKRIHIKMQK